MNYLIPVSSLEKLANPFEISFLDLASPITYEEVKSCIKSGDIFESIEDSDRIKIVKSIAYKVMNYTEEWIALDLENIDYVGKGWLISKVSHIAQLGAAIYLEKTTGEKYSLKVQVNGQDSIVQKILSPSNILEEAYVAEKTLEDNYFNWELSEEDFKNTWANKEFVLTQNFDKILKFSSIDLWDDTNFINILYSNMSAILQKHNVYRLPQSYLYKESIIENCKIMPQMMIGLLEANFHHVQKNQSILSKEGLLNLINPVLNNKDFFKEVFAIMKVDSFIKIEGFLPPEIKIYFDTYAYQFANQKGEYGSTYNIYEFFPQEYFTKKENILKFFEEVLRTDKDNPLKEYPYIVKDWVNDKEKIIDLIESGLHSNMYLYEVLPPNMQQDRAIIKAYITHGSPQVLTNTKYVEDLEMIELFCANGGHYAHYAHGAGEVFTKIQDDKIIHRFLQSNPDFLMRKNTPQEWKDNPEFVLAAIHCLEWEDISDKAKFALCNDKQLALSLINKDSKYYKYLNDDLKYDFEIAFSLLPTVQDFKYDFTDALQDMHNIIKSMPKGLWANKSFCQKTVNLHGECMRYVSPKLLEEKSFILSLFKNDDGSNKDQYQEKSIVDNLPKNMRLFLETYGVTENYAQFIEKLFFKEVLDKKLSTNNIKVAKRKI